MKDHVQLSKNYKHELNKKGMLRIRDVMYSDSGVYSCIGMKSETHSIKYIEIN